MAYLTKEDKKKLFAKYGFHKKENDTGSLESQVALFSHRINRLTQHLSDQKKDFSAQTGLLQLVGKRKKMLNYLQKTDIERYRSVLAALKLRK